MEMVWKFCFLDRVECVCVLAHEHTTRKGKLWTFSCQSLTICVVIKVLSSRLCALDIEMRTEMPEGREKRARQQGCLGAALWPWQAVGIFARGLRVSSWVSPQQMRRSSGYVILWYKSRYGSLPLLYSDNFVFLVVLPSRI